MRGQRKISCDGLEILEAQFNTDGAPDIAIIRACLKLQLLASFLKLKILALMRYTWI